jgi:hypothetical protein
MCNDFQESTRDRKTERGEDGGLTGVYLVGREGSSEQIGVSAFIYACSDCFDKKMATGRNWRHSCASTSLISLLVLTNIPGGFRCCNSDRDEQKWPNMKASDGRGTTRSEALTLSMNDGEEENQEREVRGS